MSVTDLPVDDVASLEAGLDALDTPTSSREPWGRRLRRNVVPPVVAVLFLLAIWLVVVAMHVKPSYVVPPPGDVWSTFTEYWAKGAVQEAVWNSLRRAFVGFTLSVLVGTALGLLLARSRFVRTAIGPLVTGLQSLPSVAWVPAAIIWFGLTDEAIYLVVLMGAVPSIANGLLAGVSQVPPLYLRVGRVLGARGWDSIRYVVLPAAMPGYLAGLRQGVGVRLALAHGRRAHRVLAVAGHQSRAAAPDRSGALGHEPRHGRHPRHPRRRHRGRAARVRAGRAPVAA